MEAQGSGKSLMRSLEIGRTVGAIKHIEARPMQLFEIEFLVSFVVFFVIIGGIILMGTRDTEHPITHPK
jgi:hypothetical protein